MATTNSLNISTSGIVKYDGAGLFTSTTTTANSILYGTSSNGIGSLALTDGQIAIGVTGAPPTATTISAGTGISVTNAAGSITINATGGALSWTEVTGTSQVMAINNGYVSNNAGLVTLSLPAVVPQFSVIRIAGLGAGGWLVEQNAGQLIHLGSATSTTGVLGSISSTNAFDCVELLCLVANTTFTVLNVVGNINVA